MGSDAPSTAQSDIIIDEGAWVPWAGNDPRNPQRPAERDRFRRGWVYMIQVHKGGPLKIGFSTQPAKRLRDQNNTCGGQLRLLGVRSGTKWDEAALHVRMDRHHLGGEWFYPSVDFMEMLEMEDWIVGTDAREMLWPDGEYG